MDIVGQLDLNVDIETEKTHKAHKNRHTSSKWELWIRAVGLIACVIALILLLTNSAHQSSHGFHVGVTIKFKSFKIFIGLASTIGISAASQLTLLCMKLFSTGKFRNFIYWCDQLVTYGFLSTTSAASLMTSLISYGSSGDYISWDEICSDFGNFCGKITASIVLSFVAVVMQAISSGISAYQLPR